MAAPGVMNHSERCGNGRRVLGTYAGAMESGIARDRQFGATLVEFVVVAPLVLVLVLAIVQIALLSIARSQLNFAVEYAVQFAATRNGTLKALEQGLAVGLASMHAGAVRPGPLDLAERLAAARRMLSDPRGFVRIQRLSPSAACFADWGNPLPSRHLRFRSRAVGAHSGLSVQACNVLNVRVVYGYRPPVPLVRHLLFATLQRLEPDEPLYLAERLPIEAIAARYMQSDAIREVGGGS